MSFHNMLKVTAAYLSSTGVGRRWSVAGVVAHLESLQVLSHMSQSIINAFVLSFYLYVTSDVSYQLSSCWKFD